MISYIRLCLRDDFVLFSVLGGLRKISKHCGEAGRHETVVGSSEISQKPHETIGRGVEQCPSEFDKAVDHTE